MKARNGKVARIPLEIREQLNCRLADGEPGNRLVEWLNSNPEVVKVMAEHFEGRPITDNNLSEWRAGGFEEWLTLDAFLDETRVLSENAGQVAATGISSDHLHIVLLAHHARLLKNLETMPENEFKARLNTVSKLTASIMKMRRDELQKARLELQRERLEFLREKETLKSGSSEAIGRGAGAGAGGGPGKGAGPGKSRAFEEECRHSSTSPHARPAPGEKAQAATPAPAPSRDEDTVPPIGILSPEPAPEIQILFGRIQSEFLDPGVEMPSLRDWLDSVGLSNAPRGRAASDTSRMHRARAHGQARSANCMEAGASTAFGIEAGASISPRRPCGAGFPACGSHDALQKDAA